MARSRKDAGRPSRRGGPRTSAKRSKAARPRRRSEALPSVQEILEVVRRTPRLSGRELARALQVPEEDLDAFLGELLELEREGLLVRIPGEGWDLPRRTPYRVGVLGLDRRGAGFLRCAHPEEEDVYIPPAGLRDALHGDTVLVRLTDKKARRGRLREGVIAQVLERARGLIRGTYRKTRTGGFVVPDDRRIDTEIYIPPAASRGAADGERVLVRLQQGGTGVHPQGEVVSRLRDEGSFESDLEAIAAEFELPLEHDARVLKAAAALPAVPPGKEWPDRVDLRDLDTFTVDPVDARDFDDAISLEFLDGGRLRLGVHIADVSHFVPPGSELDACAEERGTSVYLPGKVIHMLPERLAADLASLRPHEDRLTKTVRLTFGPRGVLEKTEVFRSVIRSKRRFTYEEVQAVLTFLESGEAAAELPPDHAFFEKTLRAMAKLRDRLRAARRRRGALFLDIAKIKLFVGPDGEVTGIGREVQDPSHQLIEEFMLVANEAVARYLSERELPVVGRVHPPPDPQKLEDLETFLRALGLRFRSLETTKDLQRVVDQVAGTPLASAVGLAILRTMGHAEYVSGVGLHFALATEAYCHFTSPIRRYPDLLVHQILDEHFDGKLKRAARRKTWQARLPGVAEWCSYLERRAEEAERAMVTLRLIRYLERFVGREMEGWIVSVHPFGFFVRVEEYLIEGLVHISSLGDDYYEFDREKLCLAGKRHGRTFRPGQQVRVVLAGVDPSVREITFRLAGERKARRGAKAQRVRGRRGRG